MGDCTDRARLRSSLTDLKDVKFYAAVLAEFVATAVFLFIGVSATFSWGPTVLQNDRMGVAAAFGFGIATMVWITAGLSGGHINPAVSLAMLVARKISLVRFVFYAAAQSVGAIVGVQILKAMTPAVVGGAWGTNLPAGQITDAAGVFYEVILTFSLVSTIFAATDNQRTDLKGSAPLAIGIAVFIGHLAGIPFTGASMNPARSLGSVVASQIWTHHWIYWVGPALGAVMAALLYEFAFAANACMDKFRNWLKLEDYNPDLSGEQMKSNSYEMTISGS
ncbi:aquaporin-5-like [Tubulanus polymorphus]|uniref:aquaporin-5-like n=1 Tax=Tubulanus polymorphus TaxID=672921 RepID=UPI003DA41F49